MFETKKPRKRQDAVKKDQLRMYNLTPQEFDWISDESEKLEMSKSDFLKHCIAVYIEHQGE